MGTRTKRFAAVLAGGAGTRLWPLSRDQLPKQLLSLIGRQPLLVETIKRLMPLVPPERTFVITTQRHAKAVRDFLDHYAAKLGIAGIQLAVEPAGLNTAVACAYGSLLARAREPGAVLGIFPIDALIKPAPRFRQTIGRAYRAAEETDGIVLIGIKPAYPATGYGYVRRGAEVGKVRGTPLYQVAQFKEKPVAQVASRYVNTGGYFWNSGIFIARAEVMLATIRKHIPRISARLDQIADALGTARETYVLKKVYATLPAVSLDKGVLEKASTSGKRGASNLFMMEADFQWDDVGNWLVMERVWHKDARGNIILGSHLGLDTKGSIVLGDADHLVATVGVKDLVVVHTKTATLVVHKKDTQRVGELVAALKKGRFAKYS